MSAIPQAKAYVESIIDGLVYTHEGESSNNWGTVVTLYLKHHKRELSPTSFHRKAKKLGMISSGTPDACNSRQLIVVYVTPVKGVEICIKGARDAELYVEVRMAGVMPV